MLPAFPRAFFRSLWEGLGLMRSRLRGLVSVLVVLGVLVGGLLFSGAAFASLRYAPVAQFGSEGSGDGQFSAPAGVAIDQSNGDVYVVDQGNARVEKFDAGGGFVSQFDGSGTPAGSFSGANGVAVDDSTNVLDPSAGDVYVVDAGNDVVDKFSSAGAYLGQLVESAGGVFAGVDGVAVDPEGNVWVYQASGEVDEFDDTAGNVFVKSWSMGLGASPGLAVDAADQVYAVTGCGCVERFQGDGTDLGQLDGGFASSVAVDQASGDVFVDDGQHVAQYTSAGVSLGQFGGEVLGAGSGVAVNQSSTDVYVADAAANRVEVFRFLLLPDASTEGASGVTTSGATVAGSVNPEGVALTSCEFEYGTDTSYGHTVACSPDPGSSTEPVAVTASLAGLAAHTTYHYRVTASNANGTTVGEDGAFSTPSPPILGLVPGTTETVSEYSESVTVTSATLRSAVNPAGADTTYRFEYGPTTGYGASVPVPDADIGAGGGDVPVVQHITGLQAATAYHYRVVASNAYGTTDGPGKVFTTYSTPATPVADACPNAALRTGLSAGLPDCRAYEMVSPLDKNGSDVQLLGLSTVASAGGDRVAFAAHAGFAGATGSGIIGYTQYVASHGVDGWSTRGVTPATAVNANQIFVGGTDVWAFDDELDHGLVEATDLPSGSGGIPGGINVYREDTATGALQAITTPSGSEPVSPLAAIQGFRGFSSDLGVLSFETTANMLAQATGSNPKLYAWDHGTLRLAGILPDGTVPVGGSAAPIDGLAVRGGPENQHVGGLANEGTVSGDGSRVLFVSPVDGSLARQLYMRRNATDTVWVSHSEASSPNPEPQGVQFQAASRDGRRVLFTSSDRLLDSDPGGAEAGLYMYTDSSNPEAESNLTFIARVNPRNHINGEDVYGMSEDGTRIYFFSQQAPRLPVDGVYLWDHGSVHTVAAADVALTVARVSVDGQRFAFLDNDNGQLTGRDIGINPEFGEEHWDAMYLYDEPSKMLTCVSCPPSGAAVTSGAQIEPQPSEVVNKTSVRVPFRQRFLSRDGRFVVFATADALVPQDTNGLYDVYEYDADTGRVALVSSGAGDAGSWFAGMSADGSDVFLLTRQSLVGADTDSLVDLYDARVDGGLPESTGRAMCEGEACQGAPGAPPIFSEPSRYSGPGNTVAGAAVKSKAKAKSKPRKRAKKKPGKHRRKKAKRAGRRTFRRAAHR